MVACSRPPPHRERNPLSIHVRCLKGIKYAAAIMHEFGTSVDGG